MLVERSCVICSSILCLSFPPIYLPSPFFFIPYLPTVNEVDFLLLFLSIYDIFVTDNVRFLWSFMTVTVFVEHHI